MSEILQKPLPVALVYGESESSQVLRRALGEIGVDLVCDADIGSFNVDTLGASGADVVLISLDSVIEDRLDEVYGALDGSRYRVMFDDPEISSKLDGWEHARWQRHLAAKLRDICDWDPPRPEDATPVEVHVQADTAAPNAAESPEWLDEALSVLNTVGSAAPDSDTVDDQPVSAEMPAPEPAADTGIDNAQALDQTAQSEPDDKAAVSASVANDTSLTDVQAAASPDLSVADIDDDVALLAELDALADADDPLAALSALVGDQAPPAENLPADLSLDLATDHAGGHDGDEIAAAEQAPTLSLDVGDSDAEPVDDELEAVAPDLTNSDHKAVADEGNSDWSSLEAELNAAFDSSALGAIDEVSGAPGEYNIDVPSWEQQGSEDAPDLNAPEVQTLDAPAAELLTEDSNTLIDESAVSLTDKPAQTTPAAKSVAAAEGAGNGFTLPDVSQWALVDDDEPPAQDNKDPIEVKTAQDASEGQREGSDDDADDDDDSFGLELVDPIDYLKPEAPKDVSNELFNMPKLMPMAEAVAPKVGDEDESDSAQSGARIKRVVVLGASIGGPDAVREFLSYLPQKVPACLVLVQHLGSEFVDLMVSQLSKSSALPVRIPGRAERAVHGEVLVVPSGCQLKLDPSGQLEVSNLDGEAANNPSINLTMTMAAEAFGATATAIIFSGMAKDAAAGALEIASRGGEVWVQDPESCVVSNMVDEVVKAGVARFTGTPEALAHKLVAFLQETDDD